MAQRLRAVVIGCGTGGEGKAGLHSIGYLHGETYRHSSEVELVAAADLNEANAGNYAAEFGIERTYGDYREMLAKEQPDLVGVCTWPPLHAEMVIAAADSRARGIRCEKPMALSLGEAGRMLDACERNGSKKVTYDPKDEERLSDYIKAHLDDDFREDGVVINREVVHRRGEETDIRVETFVRLPNGHESDLLTAVIEVKGCWNGELLTAMGTQVHDRYLSGNALTHGLYVVGWYNCNKWHPRDWRHRDSPKLDRIGVQRRMDEQAVKLSHNCKQIQSIVLDTSLHY